MTWTVYADPFLDADMSMPNKFQPFKATRNTLVLAIRTTIVLVGNPSLEGLRMEVYNNNLLTNAPSTLKAVSTNTFDTSDLLTTQAHGLSEIYFEFIPFGVRKTDTYHIVLQADSYTYTTNSHFAWRNVWPDPVYKTNFTVTGNNFLSSPYMINAVIGSDNEQ